MIRPNEQDKKCNACIEAAKAWRTNFVCGASMALDVDWTPNGIIESNTCPEFLRCEGFYQGEDLETCKKSMTDWETISKYDEIYEALSKFKPTTKYSDNEEKNKAQIEQYVVFDHFPYSYARTTSHNSERVSPT